MQVATLCVVTGHSGRLRGGSRSARTWASPVIRAAGTWLTSTVPAPRSRTTGTDRLVNRGQMM
jgi:hypothetical protein